MDGLSQADMGGSCGASRFGNGLWPVLPRWGRIAWMTVRPRAVQSLTWRIISSAPSCSSLSLVPCEASACQVRGVVFDVDGTLPSPQSKPAPAPCLDSGARLRLDTMPLFYPSWPKTGLERYGMPFRAGQCGPLQPRTYQEQIFWTWAGSPRAMYEIRFVTLLCLCLPTPGLPRIVDRTPRFSKDSA